MNTFIDEPRRFRDLAFRSFALSMVAAYSRSSRRCICLFRSFSDCHSATGNATYHRPTSCKFGSC